MEIRNAGWRTWYVVLCWFSRFRIPRKGTGQPDHVEIVHPSTLKMPLPTEDTLWWGGLGEAVVDEWEQTVHVQMMKDSTEEDPVVRITVQAHGKEYDFTRHINDIDPRNASYAEMAALVSCYEGTPRQVAEAPKKRSGYCAICQQSKASSGGICRESEGTDSGLSHSVIRGLDTNRLMTTP